MILLYGEKVSRARAAVLGYDNDLSNNPDLGLEIYGSDLAMLRQYLDDCGFIGITADDAEDVATRTRARLRAVTEVLCNLRGLDPNDDEVWTGIQNEIVRDRMYEEEELDEETL